jgi:ketosteroid isomerase-like protein
MSEKVKHHHKKAADKAKEHGHENIALVGRMYECFAAGDMDTLKREVFASDLKWALPGHHPLSGVKNGADEAIAFFVELGKTGIVVDNVSFGTIGDDRVVETHTGHGHVDGREYIFPTCSVYTMRNGKIANVQVYTADQHGVDEYFWAAYNLKPIPDRMAE